MTIKQLHVGLKLNNDSKGEYGMEWLFVNVNTVTLLKLGRNREKDMWEKCLVVPS